MLSYEGSKLMTVAESIKEDLVLTLFVFLYIFFNDQLIT